MGLGESLRDLPGDRHGLPDRQGPDAVDEALEVLAGDILHRDEVSPSAFLAA